MTKELAQTIYRGAWRSYLFSRTKDGRDYWEQIMDEAQPFCVGKGRPDAEWEAFIDTLPGFRSLWTRYGEEARDSRRPKQRTAK